MTLTGGFRFLSGNGQILRVSVAGNIFQKESASSAHIISADGIKAFAGI